MKCLARNYFVKEGCIFRFLPLGKYDLQFEDLTLLIGVDPGILLDLVAVAISFAVLMCMYQKQDPSTWLEPGKHRPACEMVFLSVGPDKMSRDRAMQALGQRPERRGRPGPSGFPSGG